MVALDNALKTVTLTYCNAPEKTRIYRLLRGRMPNPLDHTAVHARP